MRHNAIIKMIITSCIIGTIGCATPQGVTQKHGWIPLDTFDFIKFDNKTIKDKEQQEHNCSSRRPALLGAVLSYGPLKEEGWFAKTYTLPTTTSLLSDNLDFSACYSYGPDKLLDQINYRIKMSDINIDSIGNMGFEVGGSTDVEFKKVWRATASMSDEQKVKLLQKLDTNGNDKVFVITDTLFGDISNVSQFQLKAGGKINIADYEFNADVIQYGNDTKTETLKGLSVAFGVRGGVYQKISSWQIAEFELPAIGENKDVKIMDSILTVYRTNENSIDFRLNDGQNATIYKRENGGKWVMDKESVLAALRLPMLNNQTIMMGDSALASVDIDGGGDRDIIATVPAITPNSLTVTDIRIVSSGLDGSKTNVIALIVNTNKSKGKFYCKGKAYTVKSFVINSVDDYLSGLISF